MTKDEAIAELLAIARAGCYPRVRTVIDEEALDRINQIERMLKPPPCCPKRWHAGAIHAPHSPEHKARCSLEPNHAGFCSFMREAIARGWKIPDVCVAQVAAMFVASLSRSGKGSYATIIVEDIDVSRDGSRWCFRISPTWFKERLGETRLPEDCPRGYVDKNGLCEGLY